MEYVRVVCTVYSVRVHTLLREEDRVNTGRKRTEDDDDDMEGNY
jgi:hypothetical protein